LTVLVGVVVPGEGCVLACDSRVSIGATILSDDCPKYVIAGSCVALVCGEDGGLLDALDGSRNVDELRYRALEYQNGKDLDWALLVYDRRSEKLVYFEGSGATVLLDDFGALGSGGTLALGALTYAGKPRTLASAQKLARRACQVAIRHNATCGGKVRVLTIRGKRLPVEIS
jgi:ATP-dependent protease HslVU (ClpYQ) peptidase subunit